jgi:hypothetical protein
MVSASNVTRRVADYEPTRRGNGVGSGNGTFGGYQYGVDPVYPAPHAGMRRALRIRVIAYIVLIPTLLALSTF